MNLMYRNTTVALQQGVDGSTRYPCFERSLNVSLAENIPSVVYVQYIQHLSAVQI